MHVRVEQLNPIVGDIEGNLECILQSLRIAEQSGVELLILPEMVLTGYPVQDLLEREVFREYCYKANQKIIENTGDTALLFGSVTPNRYGSGRKMFNSAILAQGGIKLDQVNKTLLPTYDIFDDLRYFEPNKRFDCVEFKGCKLGVTICEDIWYNENEIQYHNYEVNPAAKLKEIGAQAIINISASPFTKNKHSNRMSMLKQHATSLNLPIFFSNQTGAQTDIIFDGDSLVMNRKGEIVSMTEPFKPGYVDAYWNPDTGKVKNPAKQKKIISGKQERIFEAIRLGLRDYLNKTGVADNVVLGLSGGIDSAMTTVLATEALGPGNVEAITMPTKFSSEASTRDSRQLAENLGFKLHEIKIQKLFETFRASLNPIFKETEFGIAEENLQSRIRGTLLMAHSNKFGNILLASGNKSELSIGYATIYGDMNGGLNLIGDLYKSEVYELANWFNQSYYGREIIPKNIIDKAPSAELKPGQKDTDTLPDYEIMDPILQQYIELQKGLQEIVEEGFDKETVEKLIKMVDSNEFKRFQAPPILKLSSKSFGTGRRWPLVQGWTGHEFEINFNYELFDGI